MKENKYHRVVEAALSADPAASRDAFKELSKYRYTRNEPLARAVMNKLPSYTDYLKMADRMDALVRLVNLIMWSRVANKQHALITSFLLEALQHDSGKVRQNARRASDNLSFVIDTVDGVRTETEQIQAELIKFLEAIEDLIAQHRPATSPTYIDNLPPSVYKTLVMTWHDTMAKYFLWEKLNLHVRMVRLDIPPYSWQGNVGDEDDNEPEEEQFCMHDWQEHLEEYVNCSDWTRARQLLLKREKDSIRLLKWALSEQGLADQEKVVVAAAREVESDSLPKLLMDMAFQKINIFDRSPEAKLLAMNKVARAVQSIDNNAILQTIQKHSFSRLITAVVLEEVWRNSPRKIELLTLLECVNDTHDAVDEVVDTIAKPEESRYRAEMSDVGIERAESNFEEPAQVAHYIIDWMLQIDYRRFGRKTPKQLAAIAWAIFDKVNPNVQLFGLDGRALSSFAGWVSTSSLSSNSKRILVELQEEMADPAILRCFQDEQRDYPPEL